MNDLELLNPLKRGDKKGQVKLVQEWLSLHGNHIAIDDDFGPATEAAVKDFQAKNGLAATGSVDAQTFDRLGWHQTNDDGNREGYEVCARTRGYGKMDFILI